MIRSSARVFVYNVFSKSPFSPIYHTEEEVSRTGDGWLELFIRLTDDSNWDDLSLISSPPRDFLLPTRLFSMLNPSLFSLGTTYHRLSLPNYVIIHKRGWRRT